MRKRKRKPITPEEMEAGYARVKELERKREVEHRKTKQGAFEASFVRFEQLLDNPDADTDKLRILGTLGDVVASNEENVVPSERKRNRLKHACEKLRRHGKGHLVRTLQLIAKNVNNREESIWQLMMDTQTRTLRQGNVTSGVAANSGISTTSRSKKRTRKRPKTCTKKGLKKG